MPELALQLDAVLAHVLEVAEKPRGFRARQVAEPPALDEVEAVQVELQPRGERGVGYVSATPEGGAT